MKLRNFLLNLNHHIKQNSDILDYEVIYSCDDEGNEFKKVYFEPTIGQFENREFETQCDKPNAICIN